MASRVEQWLGQTLFDLSAEPLYTALFEASELSVLDEWVYLTNEACGVEVTFSETLRLECLHLTPPVPACAAPYALPFGLRFDFSRPQVHAQLAHVAKKEGGGVVHPHLGLVPVWERYFPADWFLHVEYSPDEGRIQRLTLSLAIPAGS